MLGSLLRLLILVPLGIVIVLLGVANRQPVTVLFDPFSTTQPAYQTTLPLFGLIFILLILGVLVGGVAAWLRQGRWRRQVRRLEAENRALHAELYEIRRQQMGDEHARTTAAPRRAARPKAPPLALRAPVE